MFRLNAIALAVSGLSALAACSTVSAPELAGQTQRMPAAERTGRVEPALVVRNSGGVDSEGMYRIGRVFQGQMRYDDAAAAYRNALALDPGHVEARNALAVAYSSLGLATDAEREFKAAIARSPTLSHLHSNLGYHYLQLARAEEAVAALREAIRLDPANARALSNLAAAGGGVAAAAALASSAQGQVPLTAAAAKAAAAPASIAELARTAPVAPQAQLIGLAPNIWELQPHAARSLVAALPAAPSVVVRRDRALPILGSPAIARLEIANGNGVTGLARRVGAYLRTLGMPVPRLTNQMPFDQRRTRVHYVPGMEESARELMTTLGTPADFVMTPRIDRNAQLRVVLGKDFHEIEAVARAPLGAWKQAALAPREGRR